MVSEKAKRKREIFIIVISFLFLVVFLFLEFHLFYTYKTDSFSQNVIIFVLIQINLILILLLGYLVLRNILKTIFEIKRTKITKSIRLKLVFGFLILSFVPAFVLFITSYKFIETSLEYWFSSRLDKQLEKALFEARSFYQNLENNIINKLKMIDEISIKNSSFEEIRVSLMLDTLELYSKDGLLIKKAYSKKVKSSLGIPPSVLNQVLSESSVVSDMVNFGEESLFRVFLIKNIEKSTFILSGGVFIDSNINKLMEDISNSISTYQQLKFLKYPLKLSLFLVLLLVTLLTIFVGVWFGIRVSKRLTSSLHKLTEAAENIASQKFDIKFPEETEDEIGILIKAFKYMTKELQSYREKIEERTAYLETILSHITSGVIAIDEFYRLTLVNERVKEIFNVDDKDIGKYLTEILPESVYNTMKTLIEKVNSSKKPLSAPCRVVKDDAHYVLGITCVRLPKEVFPGYLFIIEDLTEKERIERMAAWREVARRIAHEVKNPLTPIQLSAQRLRKRLSKKLSKDDQEILIRCTTTIEKQVEELKYLVNEFSTFARFPKLNLKENDIIEVIREVISLYENAHKEMKFLLETKPVPKFFFDRDQIKRVFLNLFDNAVEVTSGKGTVKVGVGLNEGWVVVEVSDDGPGIPRELKSRIFEPYASGKGGTGLGLAIVSSIVQSHGGEIRAEDNEPSGAKFIIKLPFRRNQV